MAFQSSFDDRRLLAIELNGTLIDGGPKGREQLRRRLDQLRESVLLVYAAGMRLPAILDEINSRNLMPPDYIISSVGTEIHRMPGEQPFDEWQRYIQAGFERDGIVAFVQEHYASLALQPDESQTPLKISYFAEQVTDEFLDELRLALLEARLPARLVYSSDRFLDIIPEHSGHGPAVKYLVDSLMLVPSQIYVCGTSNNDADLFLYGYRGIVVENATYKLKEASRLRAYFSQGTHVQGLLEGLDHYGFFGPPPASTAQDITREALERAIDSLRRNITPYGFSAASEVDNPLAAEDSNYFAVWSRDGIQSGLWALCLNDPDVTECFRKTLELLAKHQTEAGQIPSNVQIKSGKPDFGGLGNIAAIDAVLWFGIGVARYAAYTGDRAFLGDMYPRLRRSMAWLRAHDSNNCGLIEIPESSDWMDLFPRSYNVLYDEVLWYLACCDYSVVQQVMGDDPKPYGDLSGTIRKKIERQFWPTAQKLSDARESFTQTQFNLGDAQYLLAQISPFGFSWRCDIYANLLAALVGLLDEHKLAQLFHFLWGIGANSPYPIKCLYPTIHSGAQDWKDYFVTNFLNLPDHYHNGGIWPFIGGLWVRFLAKIGRTELADRELRALAEACRVGAYGEWEFNEWLHGQTGRPMGKAHQAWSAAGYIAAYKALRHDWVPIDFEPLTPEMFEPVGQ